MRYLGFVLIWLAFLLFIKAPTWALGFLVTPLLWFYRARDYEKLPFWTRPWANPEDWTGGPMGVEGFSLPRWWIDKHGSGFKSFYRYHAVQNPANGLRSIEALDLDIVQEKVQWRGTRNPEFPDARAPLEAYEPWYLRRCYSDEEVSAAWYIAWQGWRAGFKLVIVWNEERHAVIKIGWRVQPQDRYVAINPNGIRHKDAGFATKFQVWRKG